MIKNPFNNKKRLISSLDEPVLRALNALRRDSVYGNHTSSFPQSPECEARIQTAMSSDDSMMP